MQRGYIHVYTGNGKGKTTAAIGLAVRASGAGLKVLFAQFMKKGHFSEVTALDRLNIPVRQFGTGSFVSDTPSTEDKRLAAVGLEEAAEYLAGGAYDVVILDEINCALSYGLITVSDLVSALEGRAAHTEVILTGRNAPRELLDHADLVTEMTEHKHYYDNGTDARVGIEK